MEQPKVVKFRSPLNSSDSSVSKFKHDIANLDIKTAVVLGFDNNDNNFLFSNKMTQQELLWLLEWAKSQIDFSK